MNKFFRQFLILVAVFFAGLVLFSKMTNHETKDLTTDMAEASLPVVYLMEEGQQVNELHGYVTEMNAASMRDTITPVESGGVLPIQIDSYGNKIEGVSFEVRSLDTTRLVQQSEAENFSATADTATADLPIQNLIREGEEYLLIIQVATEDNTCYFYTRITQEGDSHIGECLSFVRDFHDITMDKERQSELSSYMEPKSGMDNDTLQTVTINNSLSQACWGEFQGEEVTEPSASVKELNDSYNVILLNYILSSTDENGALEYYNVEEYYRVRYGTEKIYLLSFERTVEEIFRGESSEVEGSNLNLGIRSQDVDFMANEAGTVVCFVQQGELWSYNLESNLLTKVFSFRGSEEMDVRENYDEHNIRIIRASESGSVDFIVYGYMNRGEHEGQVGISVCHYDCLTNTVEEQLFLPSTDSYQIMKEEIGQAMYISDTGMFYLVMGNRVHQVNLSTMEDTVFVSDLNGDNYESSQDGRYLAWTENAAYDATVLHLTDFETGETYDMEAGEGYRIKPLGFLESDLVYGLADVQNVSADSGIFAMNKVQIMASTDHSILKDYESAGYYVISAAVEDGSINLQRVTGGNGVYVEAAADTIRNRDMQDDELVYVSETTSDVKQREVTIQLSTQITAVPNLLVPKLIISENSTTLKLSGQASSSAYYVYAKGKVLRGTGSLPEAIICADENRGVVIGENQVYVWKRAKKQSGSISSEDVLSKTISQEVQYNLTGCSLEQVLYFVGEGTPVYGILNGQRVLITGYDDNNVTLLNPDNNSSAVRGITAAAEDFTASGNQFYTVVSE